jgi:hypothetical protein
VDSAVLLSFGPVPDAGAVTVFRAAHQAETAARLRSLIPSRGRMFLVTGPDLEPSVVPDRGVDVRPAAAGSYCTSVWRTLAQSRDDWAGHGVVAVCDTDPVSGTTHLAVLRTGTAGPR